MLPLGFFIISLLYSTVGFGGGSSYLALLAVSGISFLLLPKIALICNLTVVSGGVWHYYKQGHFNKGLILPFVLPSIPMAFFGGMYPISEKIFLTLLSITLVLSGLRLLFTVHQEENTKQPSYYLSIPIGAILGFLSGVVGIGGGIFLAPIMLSLKWGKAKEVAAAASFFIWLNSLAGLIGQFTKGYPVDLLDFWPLFMAVFLGGQIGSRIGSHQKVSQLTIQRATAVLILLISFRLLFKLYFDL
jgi:uncharacterized protein